MTDTHTGTVQHYSLTSGLKRHVWVPDDWPKGIDVTVVRGTAPAGMVPDGNGGAYGPGRCVPEDWQWRTLDASHGALAGMWPGPSGPPPPDRIVQARPAPEPRPRTPAAALGAALDECDAINSRCDGPIVLGKLRKAGYDVVLADDNPTDTTAPGTDSGTDSRDTTDDKRCDRANLPENADTPCSWADIDGTWCNQHCAYRNGIVGSGHTTPEPDTDAEPPDGWWGEDRQSGDVVWREDGRIRLIVRVECPDLDLEEPAYDEARAALVAAVRNHHTPGAEQVQAQLIADHGSHVADTATIQAVLDAIAATRQGQ